MIVEMRTYKTKPGTRARFLEIFRTKSMPAHAEIGMKILGPFLSVEDSKTPSSFPSPTATCAGALKHANSEAEVCGVPCCRAQRFKPKARR